MLSCETIGQALIIKVEGELDIHTAPPFKQCVDKELASNLAIKHLVIKMDKMKFIDSSGLGVILGRYRQIEKRGGRLIFVACSPQVNRILELSGMPKIACFTNSVKEALTLSLGRSN